jgi:hypothetical protein
MSRLAPWPAVLVAALVLAPAAQAAQRYAAPAGGGSTCTQAAPCSLVTAVNGAAGNDEVIIGSGAYTLATPLAPPGAIDLHGVTGGSGVPVIHAQGIALNTSALTLTDGSTARDLDLVEVAGGASMGIRMSGSVRLERVFASGAMANGACGVDVANANLTLTDTACVSTGPSPAAAFFPASAQTVTLHARDSTFVAQTTLSAPGAAGLELSGSASGAVTAQLTNAIVHGATRDFICDSPSPSDTVTVSHTAYANTGSCTAGRLVDQGGRVSAAAALAPDGVHQLAGSPTIDAGTFDGTLDPLVDIDGDVRNVLGGNDLGADELTPPPGAVAGPPSSDPTGTAATLNGTVSTNGSATDAHFEVGTTTAYGISTASQPFAPSAAGNPITAAITGLSVGTTYHYRLVATSHSGTGSSPDATFTAAAAPLVQLPSSPVQGPAPPASPARPAGTLRLRSVTLKGSRVLFTLSRAGKVALAVQRLRTGHRKGKACSLRAHHGKTCTRITTIFTKTVTLKKGGAGRLTFGRNSLRRGHYRVSLTATAGGKRSAPVRVRFTVK